LPERHIGSWIIAVDYDRQTLPSNSTSNGSDGLCGRSSPLRSTPCGDPRCQKKNHNPSRLHLGLRTVPTRELKGGSGKFDAVPCPYCTLASCETTLTNEDSGRGGRPAKFFRRRGQNRGCCPAGYGHRIVQTDLRSLATKRPRAYIAPLAIDLQAERRQQFTCRPEEVVGKGGATGANARGTPTGWGFCAIVVRYFTVVFIDTAISATVVVWPPACQTASDQPQGSDGPR